MIVGGESGPHSRPLHLEHAREIIAACREHDVAVFVKQLGARPHVAGIEGNLDDRKGGDIDEFPDDLRIREWPRVAVAA